MKKSNINLDKLLDQVNCDDCGLVKCECGHIYIVDNETGEKFRFTSLRNAVLKASEGDEIIINDNKKIVKKDYFK